MSAINIRFAQESDNEKLMELAQRCPQEGMVSFFPIRTPRFNTLHKILDPQAWHMVACQGERIVGLVGVIHFKARVLERVFKVGYMLDLRLDKEFRSSTVAFKLIKTAVDHLQNSDTDMVIVNFLKDNKRPLVFASGRGGLPPAQYLGDNRIMNIFPIRKMRLNKRFAISNLTEDDFPEMLQLYQNYSNSGFKIAPIYSEELFRNYFNTVKGLSLQIFLLAKENGKIKAVAAIWDEHYYKSYNVLKLNNKINLANGMLKFLSLFMKVPHPVELNKPLSQISVAMPAHDNCPEAFDTLMRHINNMHLGSKYTSISFNAQENDPIFDHMKAFTSVRVNSVMYAFAKDTSIFKPLEDDPSVVLPDLIMTL